MIGWYLAANCELLTWEWTTTYDKSPTVQELHESFEMDFPLTCERLRMSGRRYWLFPLISFNSAEGRRFRYLAVLGCEDLEPCKGIVGWRKNLGLVRMLPKSFWIYGAADEILRGSQLMGKDWGGNGLFYFLEGGALTVLIFFEGRLCHWLEETGYEKDDSLKNRLETLRGFVKQDALFSRYETMEFIRIECPKDVSQTVWKNGLFKRAAMDPLGREINLCDDNRFVGLSMYAIFFVVFAFLLIGAWLWWIGSSKKSIPLEDVVPPELTTVPELPMVSEETVSEKVTELKPYMGTVTMKCDSSVRVQGVVSGKLFISDGKTFFRGDSLGGLVVRDVLKNGVLFSCRNKQFFVEVK